MTHAMRQRAIDLLGIRVPADGLDALVAIEDNLDIGIEAIFRNAHGEQLAWTLVHIRAAGLGGAVQAMAFHRIFHGFDLVANLNAIERIALAGEIDILDKLIATEPIIGFIFNPFI